MTVDLMDGVAGCYECPQCMSVSCPLLGSSRLHCNNYILSSVQQLLGLLFGFIVSVQPLHLRVFLATNGTVSFRKIKLFVVHSVKENTSSAQLDTDVRTHVLVVLASICGTRTSYYEHLFFVDRSHGKRIQFQGFVLLSVVSFVELFQSSSETILLTASVVTTVSPAINFLRMF